MRISKKGRHLTIAVFLLGVSALTGTGGCALGPDCREIGEPCQANSECCSSNCPQRTPSQRRCE